MLAQRVYMNKQLGWVIDRLVEGVCNRGVFNIFSEENPNFLIFISGPTCNGSQEPEDEAKRGCQDAPDESQCISQ